MDSEHKKVSKQSRTFFKERIQRWGPVIFVRKNVLFLSFLLLYLLSILLGVWDIKKYEIYDLEGDSIEEEISKEVTGYIEENIFGNNYFLFSPIKEKQEIYLSISRIKRIRIEKTIPNKVILFVETYTPKYAVSLKQKECKILSSDGVVLEGICEDQPQDCCREFAKENKLIYFTSQDVEISYFDDEKERLLIMEEVRKAVEVVEAFQYKIEEILLENNILEIKDEKSRIFRFTIAGDFTVQLKRFLVVVGRIKSEHMEIGTLDLRFERPVMTE